VFGFGMTNSLLGQHGRLGVFDLAAGIVGVGGVVGGLGGGGDPGLDLGLVVVDHPAIVKVQPKQQSGGETDCADGVASRTITRTVP
jgi:hypothetical protein